MLKEREKFNGESGLSESQRSVEINRPLTYAEIIQQVDVQSAKILEEQDRLILRIYRHSRDDFEKQKKCAQLSRLGEIVSFLR